jgi:chromosome segregation ATPase
MNEPLNARPGDRLTLPRPSTTPWWAWALGAVVAAVPVYTLYRINELGTQLTLAERDRQSLSEERSRLEASLSAARKQVDELKSVQSTYEAETKKSREDAKAASSQIMQFQERVRTLEADLGKARADLELAQNASRGELDAAKRDAAGLATAKSDAEARAAAVEQERAKLAERATDLKRQLDAANAGLEAANAGLEVANKELQRLKSAAGGFTASPPASSPAMPDPAR